MKYLVLFVFALISSNAFAGHKIECTAQVFESFPDGTSRSTQIPMSVETETNFFIRLQADLDGRAFTFSGPKENGPYLVSITNEPDYTKGSLTTASFSPEGRLQLSTVNQSLVHKIECFRK